MNALEKLWYSILDAVPGILGALLLLLLAYVVAKVAKKLVLKGLKFLKAEKYLDRLGIEDEATGSSLEFFGKLVFLIVFLLFLPGVLDKLGAHSVALPITGMISRMLGFIPNLLAAALILVLGFFIAGFLRQLLVPILRRLHVDKLQERIGVEGTETSISSVLAYVVYVIILIPVFIAALQVLGITAISAPAVAMLNDIFAFLPRIFIALAIALIGFFIAKLVGRLLTDLLSSVGTDQLARKMVPEDGKWGGFSLSKFIGAFVQYVIVLLFVVEALNVLQLEVLQSVGATIVAYLPFVISAVLILGAGIFLATWVEGMLKNRFPDARISALLAKVVILAVAVFMTLSQLGIATNIVNIAFIILLGALGVAFAVAFGVGGRDFAARTLKRFEEKNIDK